MSDKIFVCNGHMCGNISVYAGPGKCPCCADGEMMPYVAELSFDQATKELSVLLDKADCDADDEFAALQEIANEVKALRDWGYDGPFIGEVIEPLMRAFHKWERMK